MERRRSSKLDWWWLEGGVQRYFYWVVKTLKICSSEVSTSLGHAGDYRAGKQVKRQVIKVTVRIIYEE